MRVKLRKIQDTREEPVCLTSSIVSPRPGVCELLDAGLARRCFISVLLSVFQNRTVPLVAGDDAVELFQLLGFASAFLPEMQM
jgi:hypothetical protein